MSRILHFLLLHGATGYVASAYDLWLVIVAGIVGLWLLFIPTGLLLTRHRKKSLTGVRLWLSYLWGIAFVFIDVIVNYTSMTYAFLQLPDENRKTVTARLKHYIHDHPGTVRARLALWMCRYLIEPWDYDHCALSRRV